MANQQSNGNILVIGNGFDLDLGLKTSYHDFYNSEFWPFKNPTTLLGAYLNHEQHIDNWMDLEVKLGEYAVRSYFNDLKNLEKRFIYKKENESDYELIIQSLADFLSQIEGGPINTESTAATILFNQMESLFPPTIITFNYTNIESIAQRLGISTVFAPLYVHGNLVKRNIILGVGENYTYRNTKLPEDNDFLYKTSLPYYAPPQFSGLLSQASNITFFGLSIGGMDAPYFSGLFQKLSISEGKTLTFITRDEKSRLQILRHLRNIESVNLNDVMTRHRFEFIRTKDYMDNDVVQSYIQRLNDWELAV